MSTWTMNEIQVLREVYPDSGAHGVQQEIPRRSLQSIREQARRFGVRSTRSGSRGRLWRADEEKLLRAEYDKRTAKSLAAELDRSIQSVRDKAYRMGITHES